MENNHTSASIGDVLEVVNSFATSVETEFQTIKSELGSFGERLVRVEATMVTKDYLDEKISDLRGDLVVLTRKEDHKVKALVDKLRQKNVINDDDVREILSMEPFAQIS